MARHHENWLNAYSELTRHSESPDLFHFWTGVFTIAGALRRKVWIEHYLFQWTPNFYIVLVGPPGIAAKSTSLRIGTSLLQQVKGIHFGPNSMTWQGLTHALEDATELVPYKNEEFLPMSCITCSVKELGSFLRPEDGNMVDVLVDLWDGQVEPWKRHTVGVESRVTIETPWINVMGCTTPAWLRQNFPEEMVGGGLTSRIIFVYGDEKRKLVAYPGDEYNPDEFEKEKLLLVEDLTEISNMIGQYQLTPEAKVWGKLWYEDLWETKPEHLTSDRFQGYRARKQTHIHKLAIVIAAARRAELMITQEDLEISNLMVTGLEHSMIKVFESIGVSPTSRMVTEILAYVRAFKKIPQKDLWRHMMPIMSRKEFEDACDAAIKAGYITMRTYGQTVHYVAIFDKEKEKDDE